MHGQQSVISPFAAEREKRLCTLQGCLAKIVASRDDFSEARTALSACSFPDASFARTRLSALLWLRLGRAVSSALKIFSKWDDVGRYTPAIRPSWPGRCS